MATLSLKDRLTDWRWWFGKQPKELSANAPELSVNVIIPAYNKEDTIREVLESVLSQSYPVTRILVVDDCSKDNTATVARAIAGVEVIRTPQNRGSKAGAQNFALDYIESHGLQSDVFITLDGDTTLAPDAVEQLLRAFNHPQTIIASGTIVSKSLETIWQRGRHIQHVLNSALMRPSQSHNDALFVASGCFGAYHMERFKEVLERFPEDTIVEDLEATLRTHAHGKYRIFYMPNAICFTEDPRTLNELVNQLERWYRGLVRSLIVRRGNIFRVSKDVGFDFCFFLFFLLIGPVMMPYVLYLMLSNDLALWLQTIVNLYLFGIALIVVIVGWKAYQIGMFWKTLISIPAIFLVQTIDIFMYMRAFYMEMVRRKELRSW